MVSIVDFLLRRRNLNPQIKWRILLDIARRRQCMRDEIYVCDDTIARRSLQRHPIMRLNPFWHTIQIATDRGNETLLRYKIYSLTSLIETSARHNNIVSPQLRITTLQRDSKLFIHSFQYKNKITHIRALQK